jgi:hypothetical protein
MGWGIGFLHAMPMTTVPPYQAGLAAVPHGIFTIYEFLHGRYGRYLPFHAPLVRFALKAVTRIIARCFREAALFATIVEDFPYWENRVYPDPTGGRKHLY